jgi:hypothetical protein
MIFIRANFINQSFSLKVHRYRYYIRNKFAIEMHIYEFSKRLLGPTLFTLNIIFARKSKMDPILFCDTLRYNGDFYDVK